jgi:transcriptional antiterminator NusG
MKRFVGFGSEPVPVDDGIIELLKEKGGPSGIIEARTPLEIGDEVTISDGPFEGLTGVIQNPPDAKGRVRILMKMLNKSAPVTLPECWVKGSRPPEFTPALGKARTPDAVL